MSDFERFLDALMTLKALNDTDNPQVAIILAIFHKYGLTAFSGMAMLKELENVFKEEGEN